MKSSLSFKMPRPCPDRPKFTSTSSSERSVFQGDEKKSEVPHRMSSSIPNCGPCPYGHWRWNMLDYAFVLSKPSSKLCWAVHVQSLAKSQRRPFLSKSSVARRLQTQRPFSPNQSSKCPRHERPGRPKLLALGYNSYFDESHVITEPTPPPIGTRNHFRPHPYQTVNTMSGPHWTARENETNVSHQKLLGKGGYGEVHQVLISIAQCGWANYGR